MACATKSTCGSRSSPACCQRYSCASVLRRNFVCQPDHGRARQCFAATTRVHRPLAVDMMDNASALPTCPQRQQQKQAADSKMGQNHPHDFTMKPKIFPGAEHGCTLAF